MSQNISFREKLGLLAWYTGSKIKNSFLTLRDLKLSNPKAWNSALWNLYGLGKSESGVLVSHDTALNYSAVYNAITIIAGTIGAMPCRVYKEKKSGGKDIAKDHPLDYILHRKPNEYMTAMNYREASAGHILSWGNSFSQIRYNGMGKILDLFPITPNRVEVKWDKSILGE